MSHNQSPITLLNHRFISFHCDSSDKKKAEGSLELNTQQHIAQQTEDSSRWTIQLEVTFRAVDKKKPSPYSGGIKIEGEFRVQEDYQDKHDEALIRVTASSILYGACREMLANFTARSTHGILSLPSISFRDAKEKVASVATDKS